jgi:hypothetical protein
MAASGGGKDFRTNPQGGAPTSGGPGMIAQNRPQKSGGDETLSNDSVPEGGPLPFGGNTTDKSQDAGNPIGTGSGGNKPFKLDGGG